LDRVIYGDRAAEQPGNSRCGRNFNEGTVRSVRNRPHTVADIADIAARYPTSLHQIEAAERERWTSRASPW
jgi:hypothetical protein